MRYRYTYKYFPGQGYAGLVNGKKFTPFYDERDLEELKSKLQHEEKKREDEAKHKPTSFSFRDYLIKHGDPEFVDDYLKYVSKKNM